MAGIGSFIECAQAYIFAKLRFTIIKDLWMYLIDVIQNERYGVRCTLFRNLSSDLRVKNL